ncbi:hypothetical protein CC77DRAFT_543203 [Alternaria alternata]|uniref:Uncharacterized protein n=1 Tax=Alternaria alternata TaxID=5599 RepID=A0A177E0K3_ALTAL|nr:hypothetical protein CC77DRAFT_543203 [Alternaria alternata]OAG24742.1 hypothetical protein CC77DRAFT_543203 [Alternaria alternata]
MVTLPARSIQARSRVNRWAVSWLWIDASMSRAPLSGAPHGSGKVRLGFTYRITTLSILHSAAVGPAHSLSGTIETDCPPARPLTSSAAYKPAGISIRALCPRPLLPTRPRPPRSRPPRSLSSPRSNISLTRDPPGCRYMVYGCRVC